MLLFKIKNKEVNQYFEDIINQGTKIVIRKYNIHSQFFDIHNINNVFSITFSKVFIHNSLILIPLNFMMKC